MGIRSALFLLVITATCSCSAKPQRAVTEGDADSPRSSSEAMALTPIPTPTPTPAPYVKPDRVAKLMATATYDPEHLRAKVTKFSEAERSYIAACEKRIFDERVQLVAEEARLQQQTDDRMRSYMPNSGPGRRGISTNEGLMIDSSIVWTAIAEPDLLRNHQYYRMKLTALSDLRQLSPVLRANTGVDAIAIFHSARPMLEQLYASVVARTCPQP